MRSLTQVRRLQLDNDWTLTVPNEYPAPIRYRPRNVHDSRPFYLELKAEDDHLGWAHGYWFSAKDLTATPPPGRLLSIATTMWRHTPMYHVVVADGVAACGRDKLEMSSTALSDIPSDSVCPICRPYTGIPYGPRPEPRWIEVPGYTGQHILVHERATSCALYCTPEDYHKIWDYPVTMDADLGTDVPRCEVCVRNQDANDCATPGATCSSAPDRSPRPGGGSVAASPRGGRIPTGGHEMKFCRNSRDKAADLIKREADKQTGDRANATRTIAERMRKGEIDSYTTADGRTIKPKG